jgi:hypothetical protein
MIMTKNHIALDKDADVTPQERADLRKMSEEMPDSDDQVLHEASLDETDQEGTPLEEKGLDQDLSGDDLDVPGSADDDADEEIGEEDEENNEYSLGGDNHDDDRNGSND